MVGCGEVSRVDGYCTVAPGSNDDGAAVLRSGEPSSRQKLKASSVYVRLHWGQRFIWASFRYQLESQILASRGGHSLQPSKSKVSKVYTRSGARSSVNRFDGTHASGVLKSAPCLVEIARQRRAYRVSVSQRAATAPTELGAGWIG